MALRLQDAVRPAPRGEKVNAEGAILSKDRDGTIRLSFEGVLRNINRSGKMADGTSYRTVYALGRTVGVSFDTSFETNAAGKGTETVLKTEDISDEVTFATEGNARTAKSEHGVATGLVWESGPRTSGRATLRIQPLRIEEKR